MGSNGTDPSSYWYDACEDVNTLCCIDFGSGIELDPSSLPNFDQVADEGFKAEIDRILESINSDPITPHHPKKEEEPQVQPKEQTYEEQEPMSVDANNVARTREVKRERNSSNGDWKDGKRPRGDGWGRERGGGRFWRGQWHRGPPRGTSDHRGGRRRERDGTGTDSRDSRGYWERDKSGKMVYHNGSWESETERQAKRARKDGMGENESIPDNKREEVGRKEKVVVEEQARHYQLEVLEHAKKKNTIAFLETGAGKTLIAVLLMKSVCTEMMKENKKMLAVFLVPKVPLVYQQAEVIRERTGFRVGHYCGEMGQDFWDIKRWQREFESKQVLVMTAQILLNILRHSIIKMDAINLLILDECHHAVKKHPYSLVMSEFYHTTPKEKRPTVFGMTASPVNLKGVSSQEDCAIKIRNLETKLDSIVFTVKDRKELEKHVPMPFETVVHYDKATRFDSLHEQIIKMEVEIEAAVHPSSRRSKWQFMGARDAGSNREELHLVYGVSERTESDGAANLIQKLRAINYALGELGQWCAYKVAHSFLTALQHDERANYQLDVKFQESYLKRVVVLLQCQLSEGAVNNGDLSHDEVHNGGCLNINELEEGELPDSHDVSGGEHMDAIAGAAVANGMVTPKVQSLIKILLKYQHTEDFCAIIFVERVVTALVLPKVQRVLDKLNQYNIFLKQVFSELPSLEFVKCASLIGNNNNQEMRASQTQDTIAKFRDGRITLLVATSVAEEGLDIRQCNVVIRFDLAKTVLAYIQSRGRARKPGSDYILMLEKDNISHESFLRNARNSEETLRKEAIQRTDLSHLEDNPKLAAADMDPSSLYQVESTGAVVSLNSAVQLIHLYCSQLPSDRYSLLRPEFIMVMHEKSGGATEFSCNLQLPCNAPFEKLVGPVCSSMRVAQQAVCLAACKKLHEMGAFTDMLLPDRGAREEEDESVDQSDEGDPLPGTARHREFYPEGVADVLRGEWILSGGDCSHNYQFKLHMYFVNSDNVGTCTDPFLNQVSDFSVLFGAELDAEVLSMTMDLFVARSMITKASLVSRGQIEISYSQFVMLKSFHVRLMSIVLDVDMDPSSTPWDPAKAYLFVPVTSNNSPNPIKDIDWDLVEDIVKTDAWSNPLHRARPDMYLGTNERTLGGDKREYGFGKLRHGSTTAFGQKVHPTYGIRGAVAEFDVVKASGLFPNRGVRSKECSQDKLFLADSCMDVNSLVGRIVTAVHSGKRFYIDSVCHNMNAENSFPRKEGYLGPLEYSSYADYYRQKYGVELIYKKQALIRGRGVSYCKNLLSPRFEHSEAREGETEENLDKTYYVYLPPELCLVHPLPGTLVRGAQRLPSIMRRVESMLLAVQLKDMINYPVPAFNILEALTAASCQEAFCYERAELLGDAYLKWVVSKFLFLKYPQKHEGQLTRMRQQMVSNMALYQYALKKSLQSYVQADRFAPSRWAAPGVPPVFDEDSKELDEKSTTSLSGPEVKEPSFYDDCAENIREEGELEGDLGSYRVLSSKTLADVVEALIGVYYVAGGKEAANHFMNWVGIHVDLDPNDIPPIKSYDIPEAVLRSIDFDTLEGALNIKFNTRGLLVEAITHASRPSSGVSCYQRLEFMGDAVLDHLITCHLFFTYTNLPPGRLTDLRAAAVNNENFARVAVKHRLHVHLRHGSSALDSQIREFVKNVEEELLKPGFNSFGLSDCKAPKVLGDIVESIAGAIFLDSSLDTSVVWRVFRPLLDPVVTPETLPMHPVRELQERCQQQAEGLEYKATRSGNVATVEVYVDGVQIGVAQNPQKKMAQKLAARNALVVLREKDKNKEAVKEAEKNGDNKNGSQAFTRQILNDICLRRQWPMPQYRCINEGGPAHAKRFVYAVRVNTTDCGWTDECIGEPTPSVKKAKDSAAILLLDLLNKLYPDLYSNNKTKEKGASKHV